MVRSAAVLAVVTLGLSAGPAVRAEASVSPARCAIGLWELASFQERADSVPYQIGLLTQGGAGVRLKVNKTGRLTLDFSRSEVLTSQGKVNDVPIQAKLLFRGTLKERIKPKQNQWRAQPRTATGKATVTRAATKPSKARTTLRITKMIKSGPVQFIPGTGAVFVCDQNSLHLRQTTKLDGHGGKTVADWWFRRL
jgi:hypothetical protein